MSGLRIWDFGIFASEEIWNLHMNFGAPPGGSYAPLGDA